MALRGFGYKWFGVDKFSGPADRVSRSAAKVEMHADRMGRAGKRAAEKWERAGTKMRSVGANLSVISAGLGVFAVAALKQSSSMEQLGVAFDVLIGDTETAKRTFADLTEFATKTPFKLEEVANAGKTLLAFQVDAEKLGPTLSMLGDLAAASGKPLTEFAQIFGKIKAKGRVTMEEVNQLAEKGVSIQTELAKATGRSSAEISKLISQGVVSFEDINELILRMTTGTGQFAGLAAKQAETLGGIFSTLQGNMDLALASIGDTIVKTFDLKEGMKSLSVWVGRAAAKFQTISDERPKLMKIVLWATLLFAAMGPLLLLTGQFALSISSISLAAPLLATGIGAVTAALSGLFVGIGSVLVTFFLIPVAIAAAIASVWLLWKNWDTVSVFITDAISFVIQKFFALREFLAGIGSLVGSFFGSVGFDDEALVASTSSQTNVDLRISASPGTQVESMTESTKGTPGVNLGTHLVTP